MTLCNSK